MIDLEFPGIRLLFKYYWTNNKCNNKDNHFLMVIDELTPVLLIVLSPVDSTNVDR